MAQHRQAPPVGHHSARGDRSVPGRQSRKDRRRLPYGSHLHDDRDRHRRDRAQQHSALDRSLGLGARRRKSRWSTHRPRRPTATDGRAFWTVSTPTIWAGCGRSMPMGGARLCSTAGSSMRSRPAVHVPRGGPVSNSSTSMGRTNTTRAPSARSPLSCTRRSASSVGSVCSARRTPTIPTAASCAILSGSGTVSESRSGRFRNRAHNPAFTMSVPEQRDPFSSWRKSCSRKWASLPPSSSSISRLHYGANINITPVEASISCDRRVMRRHRPASKMV